MVQHTGSFVAGLVGAISLGFICVSLAGMYEHIDERIILTVQETFTGLREIRDVFRNTTSFLARANPAGLQHVGYGLETLEELEDLERRGLITSSQFKNFSAPDPNLDPSLLHRLMVMSWCSSGPGVPGTTPATRTPGCQCIADAYLDLVSSRQPPGGLPDLTAVGYQLVGGFNQTSLVGATSTTVLVGGANVTMLVNGTNKTIVVGGVNTTVLVGGVNVTEWVGWTNMTLYAPTHVNVSQDVRTRVADRVFRCWDQRLVRRSRACGAPCKTHINGLPLFANIVLFLTSAAFLLCQRLTGDWGPVIAKLVLVGLAVLLCVPYLVRYVESSSLNVGGVIVCVFYLIVSLHYDLDPARVESFDGSNPDSRMPNPFYVAVLVNLPLVLSAHAIQIAIAGYGRDIWAVLGFGMCGGVMGLALQVLPFSLRFSCAPA